MNKFWKKKIKSDSLNFFVSIGAGLNQISLIKEAKKMGLHVIGVDNNPSAPGFLECDLKIQESIDKHNEIYKKLRELLIDGDISGVMTKSYGVAIKTTAFLSEKFNIPFIPFNKCDNFIDKKIMKSIFIKNNIPTSEYLILNSASKIQNIDKKNFPAVLKPTIGHAKIDVYYINKKAELNKIIEKSKKNRNPYIFEKYIKGDEIITAGIIHQKKFYLIDITDKETTSIPYFVDLTHVAPSKYFHLNKKIKEIGQAVADAFDITSAPLIMEFIVDSNENLFLIEAVPEFGGEFIPDILIPARTGYNFIKETINSIIGNEFNPPVPGKSKNAVAVKYIIGKKGKLASCNPTGPQKYNGTIFSRIFKEIGSEISKPKNNLDRIGVVAVKEKNVGEAKILADKVAKSFNIRIKQ